MSTRGHVRAGRLPPLSPPPGVSPLSLLVSAQHYFDRAAQVMGLDDRIRAMLVNPEREVRVALTIERDNGQLATFTGFRVQHNSARGPMKGGLRYHTTRPSTW